MRPSIAIIAVACWSTPYTVAVAETQCVSFSDSIDGIDKNHAVEQSLKSLQASREVEGRQPRDWSCDRNCGEASAPSLLATLCSRLCITSTRCGERHCVHDLLDRRIITGGLHLGHPGLLVKLRRSPRSMIGPQTNMGESNDQSDRCCCLCFSRRNVGASNNSRAASSAEWRAHASPPSMWRGYALAF